MNRYIPSHDPKAARRRRLRVQGPEGDQPAEFDPVHLARVMRCPRCRATISTMRRWRMLCSECGHEWEEESERTLADTISDVRTSIGEYIVMGVVWTGLAVAIAILVGGPFVLLYIVSRAAGWTPGFTVVMAIGMVLVASGVGRHLMLANDAPLKRLRGWNTTDESGSK